MIQAKPTVPAGPAGRPTSCHVVIDLPYRRDLKDTMPAGKSQASATLIDGFENNEIFDGFHERNLPMPDEAAAGGKFVSLVREARRWKGRSRGHGSRARALVRQLVARQADVGGDPMGPLHDWLREERGSE